MATPEVQSNVTVNEPPPTTGQHDAAGGAEKNWWDDFLRVEKLFTILGVIFLIGISAAYLGSRIGNYDLLIVGVVVVSLALVGMASLFFPLNWILLKGFLAWRRRRAAERAQDV